jgi:hypothetical protein
MIERRRYPQRHVMRASHAYTGIATQDVRTDGAELHRRRSLAFWQQSSRLQRFGDGPTMPEHGGATEDVVLAIEIHQRWQVQASAVQEIDCVGVVHLILLLLDEIRDRFGDARFEAQLPIQLFLHFNQSIVNVLWERHCFAEIFFIHYKSFFLGTSRTVYSK